MGNSGISWFGAVVAPCHVIKVYFISPPPPQETICDAKHWLGQNVVKNLQFTPKMLTRCQVRGEGDIYFTLNLITSKYPRLENFLGLQI